MTNTIYVVAEAYHLAVLLRELGRMGEAVSETGCWVTRLILYLLSSAGRALDF